MHSANIQIGAAIRAARIRAEWLIKKIIIVYLQGIIVGVAIGFTIGIMYE